MRLLKKMKTIAAVLLALAVVLSYVPFSADTYAASKKVSTKMYTVSAKAGTYPDGLKVTVKAKKGYKVYYTTGSDFKVKKVIKSKKSKTFTISQSTTLKLFGVKSSKKMTNKKLKKKKGKSYTYKIEGSSTQDAPSNPQGNDGGSGTPGSQGSDTDTGGSSSQGDGQGSTSTDTPQDNSGIQDNSGNQDGSGTSDDASVSDSSEGDTSSETDTSSEYTEVENPTELTGTDIEISEAGSYEVSGSLNSISVKKGTEGTVNILLSDVTIDHSEDIASSDDGLITVGKGSAVVNIVYDGTNVLKGYKAVADGTDVPDGIILGKKGTAINISAADDEASLSITDTMGTVSADGVDGIRVKKDGSSGGTISIISGNMSIVTGGDGIQAENINISGGTLDIKTSYYYAGKNFYDSSLGSGNYNTYTETQNGKVEVENVDTGSHKALKGGTKAETFTYVTVEENSDYTANTKYTQEASGGITITGGKISIDTTKAGLKCGSISSPGTSNAGVQDKYIIGSPDDGIHSNNTCLISGADITIASSDDAITASGELSVVNDSKIDITTCYEGIEAATINIGTKDSSSDETSVSIVSNDDGANASSKTVDYVYGDEATELPCTKTSTSVSGNVMNMYSGKLYINIPSDSSHTVTLNNGGTDVTYTYSSDGDGIDCNGSFYAFGGAAEVHGSTSGSNSPIDTDNGFTLYAGATILETGANMGNEGLPNTISGSQGYITSSNANFEKGTYTIKDSAGNTIYTTTVPKAAKFFVFTSADVVSGSTYTLDAAGTSATLTASSEAVSAEMGGMGENTPPGMGEGTMPGVGGDGSSDMNGGPGGDQGGPGGQGNQGGPGSQGGTGNS